MTHSTLITVDLKHRLWGYLDKHPRETATAIAEEAYNDWLDKYEEKA